SADTRGSDSSRKTCPSQTLVRTHARLCQSPRPLCGADRATGRSAWQFSASFYTSLIDQRCVQPGPRAGWPHLAECQSSCNYDASRLSSGASVFVESVENGSIAFRTTSNGLITPTTFPLPSELTTGKRSISTRSNTTDASNTV